jgi:hypothetical protein
MNFLGPVPASMESPCTAWHRDLARPALRPTTIAARPPGLRVRRCMVARTTYGCSLSGEADRLDLTPGRSVFLRSISAHRDLAAALS